jgi:hypothetical protein
MDAENDTLTYSYTVSGGRVVGQGANVNWDLSGVKPGSYTITSAVDDGCGFCGKTQTQTITVKSCPDCVTPCNCPSSISVTGPSGVTPINSSMTFTANVVGGSQDNPTFKWTVNGQPFSGSSSTISVPTNADMYGQTVTATVEVGGLCGPQCQNSASSTGEVEQKPIEKDTRNTEDFGGDVPNDEIRNKLDALFSELNGDPTSRGFISNDGPAREVAKRDKVIRDHIKFRNFDASRITIVKGTADTVSIKFYVVPAGKPDPR